MPQRKKRTKGNPDALFAKQGVSDRIYFDVKLRIEEAAYRILKNRVSVEKLRPFQVIGRALRIYSILRPSEADLELLVRLAKRSSKPVDAVLRGALSDFELKLQAEMTGQPVEILLIQEPEEQVEYVSVGGPIGIAHALQNYGKLS